jgi:hypothetical protein
MPIKKSGFNVKTLRFELTIKPLPRKIFEKSKVFQNRTGTFFLFSSCFLRDFFGNLSGRLRGFPEELPKKHRSGLEAEPWNSRSKQEAA